MCCATYLYVLSDLLPNTLRIADISVRGSDRVGSESRFSGQILEMGVSNKNSHESDD